MSKCLKLMRPLFCVLLSTMFKPREIRRFTEGHCLLHLVAFQENIRWHIRECGRKKMVNMMECKSNKTSICHLIYEYFCLSHVGRFLSAMVADEQLELPWSHVTNIFCIVFMKRPQWQKLHTVHLSMLPIPVPENQVNKCITHSLYNGRSLFQAWQTPAENIQLTGDFSVNFNRTFDNS